MQIPDATAAVGNEWDKSTAWDFNKVKPKSEVVQQAKTDSESVHFASRSAQFHLRVDSMTMCSRILWHWNVNDLFERRGTAASIWQKDASQKSHEICIRAWGRSSGDLLIADCGDFATCQPPIVTSNGPSTRKSHKQCTRMSQARRYSSTPSRRNAHWETHPRAGRKRGTGYFFE